MNENWSRMSSTSKPSEKFSRRAHWARRENFSDGFEVDDIRLQFSFKYSFSATVKGD